jgi:O-antigen ligase
MNGKLDLRKVDYITLVMGVFVFFLPIKQLYAVITIFVLIVAFLFSGRIRKVFSTLMANRILWLSVLFYILHLTGMLHSSNHQYGWSDLQTKLAFVLFPLLLSGFVITEKQSRKIRLAFLAGCTVSFLIFLTLSVITFFKTQDSQVLFYKELSHWFHPTYLALYYNIAVLFVIKEFFDTEKKINSFIIGTLFLILMVAILLLSSRTATFVAYFTVFLFPVLKFGKEILTRKRMSVFIAMLLLMSGLFFGVLEFNNRYKQVGSAIENYSATESNTEAFVKQEEDNSTNARLKIWSYTIELIEMNFIVGVGTGDVKDELEGIFEEKNYGFGAQKHLNAHNQFLNTGVALGVLGIIVLLLVFIIPAVKAFHTKDWLTLLFLMVFFLNCLTESILERQVGILCFCFFYTLLITGAYNFGNKRVDK